MKISSTQKIKLGLPKNDLVLVMDLDLFGVLHKLRGSYVGFREYIMLSLIYRSHPSGYFTPNAILKLLADKGDRFTKHSIYRKFMALRKRELIERVAVGRYSFTLKGLELLNRIEVDRLKDLY